MKKLIELSVVDAKVMDLCIEGDKLLEAGVEVAVGQSGEWMARNARLDVGWVRFFRLFFSFHSG